MKTCSKQNDCVHPDGPILPESEFYKHRSKRLPHCKKCHKIKVSKYKPLARDEVGNPGELLVIKKLRSLGIYAAPGKASEFKHLDVVAWGCVRIEVKTSILNANGTFHFSMGEKSGKEKDRSDFVVLVCIADPMSYHVFPSTHAVFYHSDGRPKQVLGYNPNGYSKPSHVGLNHENMAYYLDRWDQIETRRQETIAEMLETCAEPDGIEGQAQPVRVEIEDDNPNQLELF